MSDLEDFNNLSVPAQKALRNMLDRENFLRFVRRVFPYASPGDQFLMNWHLKAITHALELVRLGKINRLIINIPPRSLKSIIGTVVFPAYVHGHDPTAQIMTISYGSRLIENFANRYRSVLTSEPSRAMFPDAVINRRKDSVDEIHLTAGGVRYSVAFGAGITGFGGDLIIIDDPMKAQEAESLIALERVISEATSTVMTRLNNPTTASIVLIMQRLHVNDLSGFFLEQGGWHHLCLPAQAPQDMHIPIGPDRTHLFREGDLLHPARLPLDVLNQRRSEMGSASYRAQYLQQPLPPDGGMFKKQWLRYFDQLPRHQSYDHLVISWDTASKAGDRADYSVATVWLVRDRKCYLLDVVRRRMEFPELVKAAKALAQRYPIATLLIEDAGSGTQLIQTLRTNGLNPIPVKPAGDKVTRALAASARFEAESVLLPREAPFLDEFTAELLSFPGRHDDQVDSMVQALNWIEQRVFQQSTVIVGYQDRR